MDSESTMSIVLSILIHVLAAANTRGALVPFDLTVREASVRPEINTYQLKRTLLGIVSSCLSTTILCAWTAVHPNVPPRNKWHARWTRLKLMFWMTVAPELVLAWAVRQYFAAKHVRDVYNERKGVKEWTLSHGHLLSMGGYTLISDPDGKRKLREPKKPGLLCTAENWDQYYELDSHYRQCQLGTLTVDEFKTLIEDPDFEFPDMTEGDIGDRSKGDGLFKLVAILQTTCFILQCIARGQQQLALTELELVTLALASLNGVTFAVWWHKPLGVQEPVKIYIKADGRKKGAAGRQNRKLDFSYCDVISMSWGEVQEAATLILDFLQNPCKDGPIYAFLMLLIPIPIYLSFIITFPFFVLFPLAILLILRIIATEPAPQQTLQNRGLLATRIVVSLQQFRYSSSSTATSIVEGWLAEILADEILTFILGWFILLPLLLVLLLLFTIFLAPFVTLFFFVSFIFTTVFGIVTTSSVRPGASHVPSFYAPNTKSDRWSRMVVFALFGVIFGSLHCIGWNFKFPTPSEWTIWRVMSLTITIIPLVVAPIDFFLATRLRTRDINSCPRFERTFLLILDLVMTILLFIYVPARLSLIAQALSLLRSQPDSALVAVDWAKYIPHLFSQ